MTLDFSACRYPPFQHQREDVARMLESPYLLIASEMRTGKTKIVIDAAQMLALRGKINRVIVVAPAPVRGVWFDEETGEISKHTFTDGSIGADVTELHARVRTWYRPGKIPLAWVVTNYEYLRAHLDDILPIGHAKALLVLDESSYVKNADAAQTKACMKLRKACGRVVLLNGTPIFHSPLDLFAQGNLLHPSILECPYVTHFKARYAILDVVRGRGGKALQNKWGGAVKTIIGWTPEGLADLQRRFAPVTIRRLQRECLDLPPKLDPVTLYVPLEPNPTWRVYRDMRDEMVTWLESGEVIAPGTAAVKALRLSQITSGFLSGVEDAAIEEPIEELSEDFGLGFPEKPLDRMPFDVTTHTGGGVIGKLKIPMPPKTVYTFGDEKLKTLVWLVKQKMEADPNFHGVVWSRSRHEVLRAVEALKGLGIEHVAALWGGQTPTERTRVVKLLHPDTSPKDKPVIVVGVERTGSFGLDFTAASVSINLSAGYSPGLSAQKDDRIYGPRQQHPVAYYNIVATGPKGEKTIDHVILAARRAGEDVAQWTAAAWVSAIRGEDE